MFLIELVIIKTKINTFEENNIVCFVHKRFRIVSVLQVFLDMYFSFYGEVRGNSYFFINHLRPFIKIVLWE